MHPGCPEGQLITLNADLPQVLLTCVQCPGGEMLTHENVLSIFQACFRIGHYQTERSKDMSGRPLQPHTWELSVARLQTNL